MLNFEKLEIRDLFKIKKYVEKSEMYVCDISLGVFLMWNDYFNYAYAIFDETLIIKMHYGNHKTCFLTPVGNNVEGALTEIERYCTEKCVSLEFACVDDEFLSLYKNRYGEEMSNYYERKWSDYIYDFEGIKNLIGKKYNGQRNHINKFKKNYPDYVFKELTTADKPKITAFLREYKLEHEDMKAIEKDEFVNTEKMLKAFTPQLFKGGYIESEGNICSFTIGEKVGDMLIIHVEKALKKYEGVYPTTFNEFVKFCDDGTLKYINREDDSGDEGLRTSKMQYQPIKLSNKNYIEIKKPMKIKNRPTLRGNFVYLDTIKESDVEAYYKLYTDVKNNKYWGYDYTEDVKDITVESFYKMQIDDFRKKDNMCLAVRRRGGKKLIGEAILYNFGYDKTVELGVRLFSEYQGLGFGKQVTALMTDYVENELNLTAVSRCFKKNERSKRTLLANGYTIIREDENFFYFSHKNTGHKIIEEEIKEDE